jgi:hypothetical protein
MPSKLALLVLVWSVWAPCVGGQPAQVILIRHAEKPPAGHRLSQKGRERAAALAPYFLARPEVREFGPPVAIYAQKRTEENRSRRPVETVKPLARELRLDVLEYAHEDFKKMVADINSRKEYRGKMVLVCWEHRGIPDIARALGVKAPKWPGEAFDRTWVITFPAGKKPTLRDLPQKLLFEDTRD